MTGDGEPRWLDPDELHTWFYFGQTFTWIPDALDAQLRRDEGISYFEYQVMAMLSMSPERTRRMSEVAALANGSLPRLSRTVDRLAEREWVVRRVDPTDGRFTLAVLTEQGWDKVVASAPAHVAEVRRLVFDPLTTEQQAGLREISRILAAVVHPHGLPPGFVLPPEP